MVVQEGEWMSIDLAAHVAILRDGQVLLTKRADVEAWVLPGGQLEVGESVARTAVREAREETGLEVTLTHLVGIYLVPRWGGRDSHTAVFVGRPVGGVLRPQEGEVIELGFFPPDALPEPLVWWHRQRIRDALNGVGGSAVWTQNAVWPFEDDSARETLGGLWARSGLSRSQFFLRRFSPPEPRPPDLEVPEVEGRQVE
jgi:8-oxo-dGTP pyrophosphatase MutT (NUDIX family)